MADPSFDVVSKVEHQEVDNALNQTAKELAQRFDFRGANAGIEWTGENGVTIVADTEERALAAVEVFKEKLIKRGQSLKILDIGEPRASGKEVRVDVDLQQGISQEQAKKVSKLIRDEGPKGVKVQVQGEELRVTSKKRDHLQEVIALVKAQNYDFAVQFTNYR